MVAEILLDRDPGQGLRDGEGSLRVSLWESGLARVPAAPVGAQNGEVHVLPMTGGMREPCLFSLASGSEHLLGQIEGDDLGVRIPLQHQRRENARSRVFECVLPIDIR